MIHRRVHIVAFLGVAISWVVWVTGRYGGVVPFVLVAASLQGLLLIIFLMGPAGERARLLWILQVGVALTSSATLLRLLDPHGWHLVIVGTMLFALAALFTVWLRRLPHHLSLTRVRRR